MGFWRRRLPSKRCWVGGVAVANVIKSSCLFTLSDSSSVTFCTLLHDLEDAQYGCQPTCCKKIDPLSDSTGSASLAICTGCRENSCCRAFRLSSDHSVAMTAFAVHGALHFLTTCTS
eukprot:352544-Chlamydomonas_euryale.AAC.5